MKFLTWNVYRHNRQFRTLFEEARRIDADVTCFQEVPEHSLPLLESVFSGCQIVMCRQFFLKRKDAESIRLHNVIISRHPLVNSFSISHTRFSAALPPRYRLSYASLDLEFAVADIQLGQQIVRVFNLHLECVASPRVRLARLEQVQQLFHPDALNVIAGDLNSFMNPFLAPFVAPVYGNFCWQSFCCFERRAVANSCKSMELKNPFEGFRTFKFALGQYDYLLIPSATRHGERWRTSSCFGSDHFGLYLEVIS